MRVGGSSVNEHSQLLSFCAVVALHIVAVHVSNCMCSCMCVCMCSCMCVCMCTCMCVLKAEQLSSRPSASNDSERERNTKPVTSSAPVNSCSDDVIPPAVSVPGPKVPAAPAQSTATAQCAVPRSPCPYRVIEICNPCWTRSKEVITKSEKSSHCKKVGHPWIGVSFLILPCKKLLANLPPTIPRSLNFAVCWDLANHKRCRRPGDCTFAHCDEEIAVWKWMCQNNGRSIEHSLCF